MAAVPPGMFIVGLYFFEFEHLRISRRFEQELFSAAVFLILLAPEIVLNWRFTFPFKMLVDGVLILATVLFAWLSVEHRADESDGIAPRLLRHYKSVMFSTWADQREPAEEPNAVDVKNIFRARRLHYFQSASDLIAFQATLTCPEQDAHLVAETLLNTMGRRRAVSVLDVGGGDGRFTASLLSLLEDSGMRCENLTDIDPAAELHAVYRNKVTSRTKLRAEGISFNANPVRQAALPEADLILASHSLYAELDQARVEHGSVEAVMSQLLSKLTAGGRVVAILSSAHSPAIRLKRDVYQRVFGTHMFDTVAEDVIPIWDVRGWGFSCRYCDSVVCAERILSQADAIPDAFVPWASYFLRCDFAKLSNEHKSEIYRIFYDGSCEMQTIPEVLQQSLALSDRHLCRSDRVMLHKAAILSFNPMPAERRKP